MIDDERPDVEEVVDELDWAYHAELFAVGYIHVLTRAIERGDLDLGICPTAWENTMNAVELAMMDHVNGRMQGPTTITVEDVERMRRLHALGAAALSGGERPTELAQLAFACAASLFGANWRRLAREAEYTLQAFLQGLPPS
ncbi:hypothetical protein BE08_15380 [Sorangium cellulosum]|uniref:Uncharacterized protein n=1 Tax=Sorangium cellulosum TaxID=56 RepID=A0A150P771_SORCE|nr:hypothetical protein BE08_15380 [Sorangium cellulosum]